MGGRDGTGWAKSPEIPREETEPREGGRAPEQAFYKAVCGWGGSYTPGDSAGPPAPTPRRGLQAFSSLRGALSDPSAWACLGTGSRGPLLRGLEWSKPPTGKAEEKAS